MLRCLRSSDTVHITTKLGTDITFSVKGREPGIFNGVTARAGVCASASFEVYIPPVETETNGRVILDGSMGYIGLVQKPLELGFEKGGMAEYNEAAKTIFTRICELKGEEA